MRIPCPRKRCKGTLDTEHPISVNYKGEVAVRKVFRCSECGNTYSQHYVEPPTQTTNVFGIPRVYQNGGTPEGVHAALLKG